MANNRFNRSRGPRGFHLDSWFAAARLTEAFGQFPKDADRGVAMKGSHSNRKPERDEIAFATQVIQDAYPEYDVV